MREDVVRDQPGGSVEHEPPASDLATTMTRVARLLARADTIQESLQEIAVLSVRVVPDVDFAGVSLVDTTAITTPAGTDPLVAELDELQLQFGEGPSIDAVYQPRSAYSANLAADMRWPRFGPAAARCGVHSLLAFGLSIDGECLGTLNLYSKKVQAFSTADQEVAVIFAAHAAVALSAARTHAIDLSKELHLRRALETRDVIGQAKGILMERQHIDADQAFDILRRASQRLNVKLNDLAADVAASPTTVARRPDARS